MNVKDIANDLVALCRAGKFEEAIGKHYSPDVRSIEAHGEPKEVQGLEALGVKGEQFNKMFEVHSCEVSDPIIADNFFSCTMTLDSTHRESGQRMPMGEVCVYEVKDGKIVLEQFFYAPPPAE